MREDKELQEKIKEVDSEENCFAVAKSAGFDFTKEEWLEVVPETVEKELGESDLSQASGGGYSYCEWISFIYVTGLLSDTHAIDDSKLKYVHCGHN